MWRILFVIKRHNHDTDYYLVIVKYTMRHFMGTLGWMEYIRPLEKTIEICSTKKLFIVINRDVCSLSANGRVGTSSLPTLKQRAEEPCKYPCYPLSWNLSQIPQKKKTPLKKVTCLLNTTGKWRWHVNSNKAELGNELKTSPLTGNINQMQYNKGSLQEFVYGWRLQRAKASVWLTRGYSTEVFQPVSVPCWETGSDTNVLESFHLRGRVTTQK